MRSPRRYRGSRETAVRSCVPSYLAPAIMIIIVKLMTTIMFHLVTKIQRITEGEYVENCIVTAFARLCDGECACKVM